MERGGIWGAHGVPAPESRSEGAFRCGGEALQVWQGFALSIQEGEGGEYLRLWLQKGHRFRVLVPQRLNSSLHFLFY